MNTVSRRVAFVTTAVLLAVAAGPRDACAQAKTAKFTPDDTWIRSLSSSDPLSIEYTGATLGEGFDCCVQSTNCSMVINTPSKQHLQIVNSTANAYSGVVKTIGTFDLSGFNNFADPQIPVFVTLTCQYVIFAFAASERTYQVSFGIFITGE